MNGDSTTGIEDIVRRNIAALRSKAGLTQQGLADEMLLRGIAWTRETVAQVETTNRRLGLTEAIVVAACLDVPVARLTATGADIVAVGESEWTAAYLGAAIAGTIGDTFPPESYASPATRSVYRPEPADRTTPPDRSSLPEGVRDRRRGERRAAEPGEAVPPTRQPAEAVPPTRQPGEAAEPGETPAPTPQKTAERIERRLRLRVTASDVDAAAQHLWSRSLEAERERRVADRQALTGGSLKTIRGHVSRDLDREIAFEMERRPGGDEPVPPAEGEMSPEEVNWEATRLNIILANKGYSDSDVTRWWNFTRHRELDDRTIAEAWRDGEYGAVSRLVESLPDTQGAHRGYYLDE
ncbi:MAG: hypothetical protein ACLQPH_13650 [Acidimicrobiales bacterium]